MGRVKKTQSNLNVMWNEMKVMISKRVAMVVLAAFVVALGGCGSRGNDAPQNKPSAFEKDLASVRRNNFQKVYVISRPDGGSLNADDKAFLKTNMPIETTMRILTDEDRRVIVGTNFDFKPEHTDALNKRFKVEDYTNRE
jgi:basic membrane lipoprotein Med (substrate-binding protein (PBP1-ABC) superfamily)